MIWLVHVLGGIALFISSLFGHPVVTPSPEQTNVQPVGSTSVAKVTPHPEAAKAIWKNVTYIEVSEDGNTRLEPSKYYSDGKAIYFASTSSRTSAILVSVKNLSLFKVIASEYATDGQTVYYQDKPIVDADPVTFYVTNGCWATGIDAHHTYIGGSINPHKATSTPDSSILEKAGKELVFVGDC